jgi:uncharacterized protein (TIGR02145 family)
MKKNFYLPLIILIVLLSCEKDEVKDEVENENEENNPTTLTDSRDGQIYDIVRIGKQTWMAENLNYIPDTGSCAYDNDTSNAAIYGRLYNWWIACEVCPKGWHLPSDDEWKRLEMHIGMSLDDADLTGARGTDEGSKLKASFGWGDIGNGIDSYGFSALPGGSGKFGRYFNGINRWTYFWTSTEHSDIGAWCRELARGGGIYRNYTSKDCNFSIRCVRD